MALRPGDKGETDCVLSPPSFRSLPGSPRRKRHYCGTGGTIAPQGEIIVLKPDDVAPDFTLHTVDGQPVSLSDTLQGGRNALLVFLRHLG